MLQVSCRLQPVAVRIFSIAADYSSFLNSSKKCLSGISIVLTRIEMCEVLLGIYS